MADTFDDTMLSFLACLALEHGAEVFKDRDRLIALLGEDFLLAGWPLGIIAGSDQLVTTNREYHHLSMGPIAKTMCPISKRALLG